MLNCVTVCPDALASPRTPADLIEDSCGGSVTGGKRILVAYDTIHGSTAEVAKEIGTALCARGFQVDIRFVGNVTSLADYDAVILGSAIYEFRWLPDAMAFLKNNTGRAVCYACRIFYCRCLALSGYAGKPGCR